MSLRALQPRYFGTRLIAFALAPVDVENQSLDVGLFLLPMGGGPIFSFVSFSSLSPGVRPRAAAGGLAETGQRQHVPWLLRHLYTQAANPRSRRTLSSEISIAGLFTYDTTRWVTGPLCSPTHRRTDKVRVQGTLVLNGRPSEWLTSQW